MTIKSNNKALYIIFALFTALSLYMLNQRTSTTKQPISLSKKQQSAIHSLVEQYNNQIWLLLEPYNIDKDNFDKLFEQHSAPYKRQISQAQNQMPSGPQLSTKTTSTISKVCSDFNIPLHTFKIVPYIDDSISPACVIDDILFVDDELLQQFPEQAQYFVLGHELQHVHFKDHFLGYIAQENMPNITKQANHPFNRLHRLQELRADSATITHSKRYADGQQQFLKKILTIHGEGQGITHPKIATRLALNTQATSMNQTNIT